MTGVVYYQDNAWRIYFMRDWSPYNTLRLRQNESYWLVPGTVNAND